MNCKQGDIAIVVRSKNGHNFGKIVTCLRLATKSDLNRVNAPSFRPVWVIDRTTTWTQPGGRFPEELFLVHDEALRPLRGTPAGACCTQIVEREVGACN